MVVAGQHTARCSTFLRKSDDYAHKSWFLLDCVDRAVILQSLPTMKLSKPGQLSTGPAIPCNILQQCLTFWHILTAYCAREILKEGQLECHGQCNRGCRHQLRTVRVDGLKFEYQLTEDDVRKVRHGESTNGKNLGWGSCRWSVYACLYNSLPQFANEVFSKFLVTKFR